MPDRAILFADVCNSTGITETVGDAASRKFIGGLLDELGEITAAHEGEVVKTIGDEIMSSFPSALQGISAAIAMQRAVNARPPFAGTRTAIRIGLQFGPVILERNDVFGDVVNVAARITSLSAADQVLTTVETVEGAEEPMPYRSLGIHGVKGREVQLHLAEVLWRGETAQMTVVAPKLDLGRLDPELEIALGDERRSLKSAAAGSISLGRGGECDLVVPSASASRAHAAVHGRAGRFYLEDHSTNGTYVRPDGGQEMFVHRDEVLLQGSGLIRLGEPIAVKGPLDIEYHTKYES